MPRLKKSRNDAISKIKTEKGIKEETISVDLSSALSLINSRLVIP
jgi:hypothetical protein